ncbi:hypothetical protein ZOSMA_81G01240 [Zostera marina]|uniref:WRC domain-containing protein n=1 Tax=Zostera marina TaxID=29655 RepID=A0A0K9NMR7_ZOSMR|nr:hypothetical protein ZOSMA_81G01240 [Zostera marina]
MLACHSMLGWLQVQQKQQEQGTQDRLFMVEGAHKNYSPAWCKNIQQGFHIGNKWDDEKNKSSSAGRETATASTATSGLINGDRHESQKSRKRRGNPAVLMEGSRCSRVNGRGWRCCQQTLVGYSLCEHHLGKGRLRSMTSAKSKGKKNKLEINSSSGCSSSHPSQVVAVVDDDNDQEGKNVGLRMKGGKKMGMVKAKSISSILLAQITEDEVLSTNGNESRCSSNSRSNLKIVTT